jgi:cellulose synthase operon protein C
MREDDAALQNFRRAAELQPSAAEHKIAIATLLLRKGNVAEAMGLAAQLRKNLGGSSAGLTLEGDLLIAESKTAEAITTYQQAFQQDQTFAIAARLYNAYRQTNKLTEAQGVFDAWLRDNPTDIEMRLNAGEQESARQNWAEALKHFDQILRLDPKQVMALRHAAWALNKLKDPRAIGIAEKAYALSPQTPAVVETLGYVLAERGDTLRGIELLKQAVALAPRTPGSR